MPRGRGVGVAKSLEIGHPSKNWNARFGQELLVFNILKLRLIEIYISITSPNYYIVEKVP